MWLRLVTTWSIIGVDIDKSDQDLDAFNCIRLRRCLRHWLGHLPTVSDWFVSCLLVHIFLCLKSVDVVIFSFNFCWAFGHRRSYVETKIVCHIVIFSSHRKNSSYFLLFSKIFHGIRSPTKVFSLFLSLDSI